MKTAIDRTTTDKAPKHLKLFLTWGLAICGVAFVLAMPILGFVVLALSSRALMLTFHPANAKLSKLMFKRVLATIGIIAGIILVWAWLSPFNLP